MVYRLHREQTLGGDPEAIWAFFASPHNLNRLTPEHLRFRILGDVATPMYAGQMIEYRVSFLPGVWTRWLTEITHVEPGRFFVDEQRLGPYALWHHEHRYRAIAGGVVMTDLVTYDPGWGPLGQLVHAAWIRRQLEGIFAYRAQRIAEWFPPPKV